jgi:hypothetical protein
MPPVILADYSTGETAGIVAVATLLGGAAQWLLSYLRELYRERRQARKEDDEDAYGRLENLLGRYEQERNEQKTELRQLRRKLETTSLLAAKAVTWIRHLESRLGEHNIPFDRFEEPPDETSTDGRPRSRGETETNIDNGGGYG